MNTPSSPLHMEHSFLRWDALRARLAANESTLSYNQRQGSTVLQVQSDSRDAPGSLKSPVRLVHIPCSFGLSSNGDPLPSLLTSAKAAMMAAYDFNQRNPVIVPDLDKILEDCNVHMTLDFYDTERSVIPGATTLTEYIHPKPFPYQATAVAGAVRSAVSIPMAILNSIAGIPQISYASTSSELNSRASYPLFGRVVPSTDGDAAAALDYFVNILGTTHLAILYVKDTYGTAYQLSLESAANQVGVETISIAIDWSSGAPDFEENMRRVIQRLEKTGYRHFMGVLYHYHLPPVVRLGRELGVLGPGRFWLFGDGIRTPTISAQFDASDDPLAFHGMGVIAVGNPVDGRQTDRFLNWYRSLDDNEEFREYYAFKTPLETDAVVFLQNTSFPSPTHFAPLMYDAIMSLGVAACQTKSEFFNGTELFDTFLASDFVGASGPVSIDPETGTRRFDSAAYAVSGTKVVGPTENGEFELEIFAASGYVGEQAEDGSFQSKWTTPPGAEFNYSDFTLDPPPSLPPLEPVFDPIPTGARAVALSMACIVGTSAIIFALWTIWHRNDYVVKASQPGFLLVVGFGCFLMAGSVVFIVSDSPPMSEDFVRLSCMFGYWPFSIGFSLAFGGLFAKTWRINRILGASTSFRRVVVTPRDVMLPSALFLAGNVILLTLWQIFSPLEFKFEFDEDGSVDEYGRPNSLSGTCESENGWSNLFLLLIFLLNGAAVVAANVQIYRAKRITTEFSESRFISIAMAITLQSLLISLPIFVLDASNTMHAMARTFAVILCSGSILFLIFLPKIVYHRSYEKERRARQRRLAERRQCSRDPVDMMPELEEDEKEEEPEGELVRASDADNPGSNHGDNTTVGMGACVAESVVIPRRPCSDSSSGLRIKSLKSSSDFLAHGSTGSFAANNRGHVLRSSRDCGSDEMLPPSMMAGQRLSGSSPLSGVIQESASRGSPGRPPAGTAQQSRELTHDVVEHNAEDGTVDEQ